MLLSCHSHSVKGIQPKHNISTFHLKSNSKLQMHRTHGKVAKPTERWETPQRVWRNWSQIKNYTARCIKMHSFLHLKTNCAEILSVSIKQKVNILSLKGKHQPVLLLWRFPFAEVWHMSENMSASCWYSLMKSSLRPSSFFVRVNPVQKKVKHLSIRTPEQISLLQSKR